MEGHGNLQLRYDGQTVVGMHFQERRVSPRYDAENGFVAIAGEHVNAATTRLLNVSWHGLAFAHISPLPLAGKLLDINLLVADRQKGGNELFLHMVRGEVMSIEDIDGSWNRRGGRARRYGLRFVGLTPQQQGSLERFFGVIPQMSNMFLLRGEMAAH